MLRSNDAQWTHALTMPPYRDAPCTLATGILADGTSSKNMVVLGTNEKYSALFVVATEMQVSVHTEKLVKWVSRITHITDYPETNKFLRSLNKGDFSEAISPQLLLLIYILEALIINDKGYNYGKIVPVLYSSSKMLPGFIKGGYLYKRTVITTS